METESKWQTCKIKGKGWKIIFYICISAIQRRARKKTKMKGIMTRKGYEKKGRDKDRTLLLGNLEFDKF